MVRSSSKLPVWLRQLHRRRVLIYIPAVLLIVASALFADFVFLLLGWLLLFVPLVLHFALARRRTTFLRRRLLFRSEGRWYVGITFAIGLAAMNTGTNLLYLILGMLLSLILVSGVLSEWSFRALELERQHATNVRAGEPLQVILQVRNHKRIIPAIAVRFEERGEDIEAPEPCAVALHIGPGSKVRLRYQVRFARRGAQRLERIDLASGFPFGLFDKVISLSVPSPVLVYPRIHKLAGSFRQSVGLEQCASSEGGRSHGRGLEFRGVREYRFGDELKHIHWRSSARLGSLRTRIFEGSPTPRVAVVLDAYLPEAEGSFEPLMEAVASVVAELDALAFEVALLSDGFCATNQRDLDEINRHLALLEPCPSPLDTRALLSQPLLMGARLLVVLGVGPGCAKTAQALEADTGMRSLRFDLAEPGCLRRLYAAPVSEGSAHA